MESGFNPIPLLVRETELRTPATARAKQLPNSGNVMLETRHFWRLLVSYSATHLISGIAMYWWYLQCLVAFRICFLMPIVILISLKSCVEVNFCLVITYFIKSIFTFTLTMLVVFHILS